MADTRKVILKKKIEGEIIDLLTQTSVDNVIMPDGSTLAEYLATITVGGITAEEVDAKIEAAVNAIIDGAPEAYDTLKEIAAWIEDHEDVYQALVLAIAEKVDKEDLDELEEAIYQAFETFKTEINNKISALNADNIAETANRKYVTEAEKAKIAAAGRILVGSSTPADFTEQDLFLQITE